MIWIIDVYMMASKISTKGYRYSAVGNWSRSLAIDFRRVPFEDMVNRANADLTTHFNRAFKPGRHGRFTLKRLITNSKSQCFPVASEYIFFGKVQNLNIERLFHVSLLLRQSPSDEPIQNSRSVDQIG